MDQAPEVLEVVNDLVDAPALGGRIKAREWKECDPSKPFQVRDVLEHISINLTLHEYNCAIRV